MCDIVVRLNVYCSGNFGLCETTSYSCLFARVVRSLYKREKLACSLQWFLSLSFQLSLLRLSLQAPFLLPISLQTPFLLPLSLQAPLLFSLLFAFRRISIIFKFSASVISQAFRLLCCKEIKDSYSYCSESTPLRTEVASGVQLALPEYIKKISKSAWVIAKISIFKSFFYYG